MKLKLKVLRPFKDKNDLKVRYEAGDELVMEADAAERINDLVARGLCAVVFVESDPAAPAAAPADDKADDKPERTAPSVAFGEQEYPLAAMKVALEAIGAPVSKNAGVPAVTEAVEALTEEQKAALGEVLAAKEE